MIRHFVIIKSSYFKGKRIALHIACDTPYESFVLAEKTLVYLKQSFDDNETFPTHMLYTDDTSWDSVLKADSFFENIELIATADEFIALIYQDSKIQAIDVAKYIAAKVECTHLKLQKLLYLCYADYLTEYKEKLFDDKIVAYRYGPVVQTVYDIYAQSGSSTIEEEVLEQKQEYTLARRSRLLASKNGMQKAISIDKTLDKYGSYQAFDLVNITHKSDAPWSIAKSKIGSNQIITDEIIEKYHINEQ